MYRMTIAIGLALTLTLPGVLYAEADKIMERLKSLEGDWMVLDEQGEATEQVGARFRLTAGGSALRELMFPDSSYEMLNVYHMDGDRVLMTHYCSAGSQPRLEVVPAEQDSGLLLKFESITNLASPEAHFMHHAEYQWEGEDRLTTIWYGSVEGEVRDEATVFRLARQTPEH